MQQTPSQHRRSVLPFPHFLLSLALSQRCPSSLQRWHSLQLAQQGRQTLSLHLWVPLGQPLQVPLVQLAPTGHRFPQEPQFSTSVFGSTQVDPHLISGSAQTSVDC